MAAAGVRNFSRSPDGGVRLDAARTVADIAGAIGRRLAGGALVRGNSETRITGLAPIETAGVGELTHLSGRAYRRFLATTNASAVLLRPEDAARCPTVAVVVANPYLAFAHASQFFDSRPRPAPGIAPGAHVHPEAKVHPTASVAAGAVVATGARIDRGVDIGAGVFVGEHAVVGVETQIHANATLYASVRVGARCVVHAGAVVGADGFGFTPDETGAMQAIAQLGSVTIGDDVVIGAGTTIDRGTLTDTVIHNGVKMDNQVQIGHNCDIGEHTVLCGRVGFAGSTRVGRHCVFGGGAGVAGEHPITICDRVRVGAATTITRSIDEAGVYLGTVLHNTAQRWKRTALRLVRLDEYAKRLARVEAEVQARCAVNPESRPAHDKNALL